MRDFNKIAYGMIDKSTRTIGLIPRKWSYFIGNFLGQLWFGFDKRHRHVALDNLAHAFGDKMTPVEIKRLARQVFKNVAQIIFEIGWSMRLSDEDFDTYFSINGLSNLQTAQKKQRGVLLLTAHIGNWELLPVTAAMINLQAGIIYRPLDFLAFGEIYEIYSDPLWRKGDPKAAFDAENPKKLETGGKCCDFVGSEHPSQQGRFCRFFWAKDLHQQGAGASGIKDRGACCTRFYGSRKIGF